MGYEVDWERLEEFLNRVNPSSVLVEAPPGLWREAEEVCSYVVKRGIECIRSAVPVFGACMALEHFGGEAIVHLGHYPYPWWRPSKPTLFLECPWNEKVNWEPLIKSIKSRKVVVGAPAQHVRSLEELKKGLEKRGVKAITGLILGCDYRLFDQKADEYVVVSGGEFHSLGGALYLKKPILHFDPYTGKVREVDPKRVLMKRMWKVQEAMDGKRIALIDGIEGQSRLELLLELKRLAEEKDLKVRVFRASILTRDFVVNVLEEVDFAAILSCPRLPIDDFGDLHKPVLTPGEARAAITKDLSLYSFPW